MLIGGTVLSVCSLAVLCSCTSARFSVTVGFLPTAEDNTACNTGAWLASSPTWVVSVNSLSPSGDTSC